MGHVNRLRRTAVQDHAVLPPDQARHQGAFCCAIHAVKVADQRFFPLEDANCVQPVEKPGLGGQAVAMHRKERAAGNDPHIRPAALQPGSEAQRGEHLAMIDNGNSNDVGGEISQ